MSVLLSFFLHIVLFYKPVFKFLNFKIFFLCHKQKIKIISFNDNWYNHKKEKLLTEKYEETMKKLIFNCADFDINIDENYKNMTL